MNRYIEKFLLQDLNKKMVFIGGPRQVGKTTLCKKIRDDYFPQGEYFNWDLDEDRRAILKKQWLSNTPLIIFDELHKYPRWKRWIKGIYDTKTSSQQYIVTGSARLDGYRKGGDSLMGRYHYWRLHPFTLDEYPKALSAEEAYHRLLTFGGFPEPFLSADEREARRWRRERFDRIFREDVRDLDNIHNIQLLNLFTEALRHRVGNLIVLSNIASDLEISPKTAKAWLAIIEKMYIAFCVYPFTKKIPRSILKPAKVYFFDNADVLADEGARLENLIAAMLLKRIHFLEDYHGFRCALHYIRDKEGREIDFAVIKEGVLESLIEVKLNDEKPSKALQYYTQKLKPKKSIQIVGNLKRTYESKGIIVTNPIDFSHPNFWSEAGEFNT